jgi:hypothetical protein
MGRERLTLMASLAGGLALLLVALIDLFAVNGDGTSSAGQPLATPTMTIEQWDSQVTNDTYFDVARYPERYLGQAITWTCNLANFFGDDSGDGRNNMGCWEYTGQYDGDIGDGEIILSLPGSLQTGGWNVGDDVVVRGTIATPYDGVHPIRRAYAGPVIDVWSVFDKGHDPNAN